MAESTKPIQTVLIIFAMDGEASPLVKKLGLQKDDPSKLLSPSPCESYSGRHDDLDVHVVWAGKCSTHGVDNVGTVPAALSAYIAIQAFKPDLVISAGTAGGFKSQGAEIGDVFVSTAKMNHDRRIQLPNFEAYGIGFTQSHPTPTLQAALNLKSGVVSSGNSLDFTEQCMKIMKEQGVAVKEMEAAAISWVCAMFATPMFCVKAITDIVDGGKITADEFVANFTLATTALQTTLPKVLEFMSGKKLGDL